MARLLRLAEAEAGGRYRIIRIEANGIIKRRILDMGLSPGAIVKVLGFAPLGDPIDVEVKGTSISIRREEAETIIVEEVGDRESE